MTRKHSLIVVLHWGMAGLIPILLLFGGLALTKMHMIGGMIAAFLLALRIAVRLTSDRLSPTGHGWQRRAATAMHLSLYGLLVAVVLSGIAVAVEADLWVALVNEQALAGFTETALYPVHAALTKLLMVAMAGHFAAALWHQFILRDRILSRMWFAKTAQKQT